MRNENGHFADDVLLRALDGELSERRQAAVNAHLGACSACRTRYQEIQQKIEDFHSSYRSFDTEAPPAHISRALLKARLSELAARPAPGVWDRMLEPVMVWRRSIYVTAALVIAVVGGFLVQLAIEPVRADYTPDVDLTPGLTQSVSVEDICSKTMTDPPEIPQHVAHEVFTQYGIQPQPRAYEMDYLITPALGGAHDIRNLWPQPYSTGTWNAHVKDALEDHLHRLVCQGRIELATAQRDIATNWVVAYQKYFGTEQPLPGHLGFYKDRPWE